MAELRDAVKIVLERVKTHPEDFDPGGRLAWVFSSGPLEERGLNDAEIDALKKAFIEFMYNKFHQSVLGALLENAQEPSMVVQGSSLKGYYTKGHEAMRIDSSGNLGIGSQSSVFQKPNIRIGQTTLTEEDLKKLKKL